MKTEQILKVLTTFLKPFIDSNSFKITKQKDSGIIAGKLRWNSDNEFINVYVGLQDSNILFVPFARRFAQSDIVLYVHKQLQKQIVLKRVTQVRKYLGKTTIELSNGTMDVHNYSLMPHEGKKDIHLLRYRDIIEVVNITDKPTNTLKGLYEPTKDGIELIRKKYHNFEW